MYGPRAVSSAGGKAPTPGAVKTDFPAASVKPEHVLPPGDATQAGGDAGGESGGGGAVGDGGDVGGGVGGASKER